MLPYAGYVDPESTLAIGVVHHDGHLEATERTFCSVYHTFMFGFHPFAVHASMGYLGGPFNKIVKKAKASPKHNFQSRKEEKRTTYYNVITTTARALNQ